MTRLITLLSFLLTLGVIRCVAHSGAVTILLLLAWGILLRPWRRAEFVLFVVVGLFFLGQNYAVLQAGGFSFRQQDILLMPYYEPCLWGYWFLHIQRMAGEPAGAVRLAWRGWLGVAATAAMFTLFGADSDRLLIGTLASCALLLILFHEPMDLFQGVYALALGFAVEYFGVSQGYWHYPHPDLLGMPYWFASMWFSVGILGRRFVVPLAEWLAQRLPHSAPVCTTC